MVKPVEDGLSVVVCRGPSCSLMDSESLLSWCRDLQEAGLPISFEKSGCTGNCSECPVVQWNGRYLTQCSPARLTEQLILDGIM